MSMGFNQRRLVPSSVLGCRRWSVYPNGTLHSFSAGYMWKPGWQVANCHTGRHHLSSPHGQFCGCGFWAYWNQFGEHVRIGQDAGANVVGIIEGRGDAVVGGSGFRISEARIVAIILPAVRRRYWLLIAYCAIWAIYFMAGAVLAMSDGQEALTAGYGAIGGAMLGVGIVAWLKLPISQRQRIARQYPDVKFYASWDAAFKDYPVERPTWKER